jgi:ADP-ribosylglycohydrolase
VPAVVGSREPNPDYQHEFLTLLKLWVVGGFCAPGYVNMYGIWNEGKVVKAGLGCGATTGSVIFAGAGASSPARRVWEDGGKRGAANGALMRVGAEVLAVLVGADPSPHASMQAHIISFCQLTHYDPRCVASCLVIGLFLAEVLGKACAGCVPSVSAVGEWVKGAVHTAEMYLRSCPDVENADEAVAELRRAVSHEDFASIQLDEAGCIGYTYKCLAAAVTALRLFAEKDMTYTEIICDLVACAGDADTNAAVAGKVLGAIIGCRDLFEIVEPQKWALQLADVDTVMTPRLRALLGLGL